MDIGIVTIAYNGYGKFLPQWCESVSKLDTLPSKTTVALGKNHGLTQEMKMRCLESLPDLKIVEYKNPPTMGGLRNVAVKHTPTEWIQYLSADDLILPWAIEEYEKFEADSDFIVIKWQSISTWEDDPVVYTHHPRTPIEMAQRFKGRGFINNQSPYRREFWQRRPYQKHDFPNAPFVADMVEQGARFSRTERPCTMYLRRLDSHCGKYLGRRGQKASPKHKALARKYKNQTVRRIDRYYNG